jgi:hypothetical protein
MSQRALAFSAYHALWPPAGYGPALSFRMLVRLIYVSRCAASSAEELEATLAAVQSVAIPRNRAADVTGVLIVHGGRYLQALEGPEEAVREIYAAIARDPRHATPVILSEDPIETRLFGRWSLGCRIASALDAAALNALDRRDIFDPATALKRVVMRCLTVIAKAHGDKFDSQQRRIAA